MRPIFYTTLILLGIVLGVAGIAFLEGHVQLLTVTLGAGLTAGSAWSLLPSRHAGTDRS